MSTCSKYKSIPTHVLEYNDHRLGVEELWEELKNRFLRCFLLGELLCFLQSDVELRKGEYGSKEKEGIDLDLICRVILQHDDHSQNLLSNLCSKK